MKRQQFILILSSLVLFTYLFFFGRTIPDKKDLPVSPVVSSNNPPTISTKDLLLQAKSKLSAQQSIHIVQLENSVVRGDVKDQQISVYNQLAKFWGDTMHNDNLSAYYTGEAAKLENSEKKLNFAAQILLEDLMAEDNVALKNWQATNAQALFQESLKINPANDSAKIGIGACYMFGNIADNPMQGILVVRQIAEKNPDNLYAQTILGLGDEKSGQFDKAVERFSLVVKKQPDNLEAVFHLAEVYDQKGDKANAIKWYKTAEQMVGLPETKKEIEAHISALQ